MAENREQFEPVTTVIGGGTPAGRHRAGPQRHAPVDLHGSAEARAAALRRIIGEISANLDLGDVFEHVLDSSHELFGNDVSGLWLITEGEPLRLVAQRDLDPAVVEAMAGVDEETATAGMRALREGLPIVTRPETSMALGNAYAAAGFGTANHVPLLFREEPIGLLGLYHRTPYDWTPEELDLCTSFGGQIATAVVNARLFKSVKDGEARLQAISELSSRLNRIQDVEGIGEAIVSGADRLIAHDTIRVYHVNHVAEMCEPVAFHGEFLGIGRPSREMLRVRVGQGLTGWVALHNATIRLGDASADPRARQVGNAIGTESMLLVPMSYESRVLGVIVVSKAGREQFSEDDQRTLEIFAGYAAQAIANAEAFDQVRRQQDELSHRLESQRRLLQVSERLLSTLDQSGVLEMIADSLKAVVSYDSLTIYRVDRAAWVRRAVVARDQFADVILSHEAPLDLGITGWAIRNAEAILANDAHEDSRSVQIPGTPLEQESMIVCPLLVAGEVIGTLNVSRLGAQESHFSRDEFELVQLFAAQASIALRNAETHGAVVTRAEHDALTGLRNHGAFQRDLGEWIATEDSFVLAMLDLDAFKAFNDTHGHPAGDALLAQVSGAMQGELRRTDRLYRYGGDEFAMLLPGLGAHEAREVVERVRAAVARLTSLDGPMVTVTAGMARFPEDGAGKDEVVGVADRSLYLAKPLNRSHALDGDSTRDLYLAALDEATFKMLERLEPDDLLRTIVERAGAMVGVSHGYLYLLERPDEGEDELVVRVGTGLFAPFEGYRLPRGTGLGWAVMASGHPEVVDDYAEYIDRSPDLPSGAFGAVCAVPLTSGGEVLGVIGLASGDADRPFSQREIASVARFAQLASIALDSARQFERAQTEVRQRAHAAMHDLLTGLPNRSLLLNRLAEALEMAAVSASGRSVAARIGLIVLDLDRFTVVNESLGHAVGDALLVAVGGRIASAARSTDTVARLGSDEYGILLGPVRSHREAERVANRIEAALSLPFDIDGREVSIGASMGLAIGRSGATHPGDLLKEAEIALHRAKADPTRSVVLFDPEMRTQTLERATLEHDLRRAIERSELVLHYQPILSLATGTITGMEALLRWNHPQRGLVQPMSFIPLAEETGLILPIGRWVLQTACEQVRDWKRRLPAAESLVISVNLSARQFARADLTVDTAAILDHSGLDPASLELEITESVVMDQSEASIERLRSLRALGVRLVLDDFGTGYSSLSYLRRLPLDTIKIDRSFITELEVDDADVPIVGAVIDLAHGLGIDVVAEGIETPAQLEVLRRLGCDRGQGYYFARPLPAAGMEALLTEPDGRAALIHPPLAS